MVGLGMQPICPSHVCVLAVLMVLIVLWPEAYYQAERNGSTVWPSLTVLDIWRFFVLRFPIGIVWLCPGHGLWLYQPFQAVKFYDTPDIPFIANTRTVQERGKPKGRKNKKKTTEQMLKVKVLLLKMVLWAMDERVSAYRHRKIVRWRIGNPYFLPNLWVSL